jgi:hypothetical protein
LHFVTEDAASDTMAAIVICTILTTAHGFVLRSTWKV